MTQAISLHAYRKLTKIAKENAAALVAARQEGLKKIANRRFLFDREDAIAAYCDARFWAKQSADRLASVHPEKAPNWSTNARKRFTH